MVSRGADFSSSFKTSTSLYSLWDTIMYLDGSPTGTYSSLIVVWKHPRADDIVDPSAVIVVLDDSGISLNWQDVELLSL